VARLKIFKNPKPACYIHGKMTRSHEHFIILEKMELQWSMSLNIIEVRKLNRQTGTSGSVLNIENDPNRVI